MKLLYTLVLSCLSISIYASVNQNKLSADKHTPIDKSDYLLKQKVENRNSHIFKSKSTKTPPLNDDICNAIELLVGAAPIIGDNSGATLEPNEPIGNCHFQNDPADSTVWYFFVVDSAQKNYIVTTNLNVLTNDDTQLTGYSSSGGCSGNLTQIACDEDDLPSFLSTMIVTGTSIGDTVWVQVDGWSGTTGTFEIQLYSASIVGAPANDNICNAQEITVNAAPIIGDNTNATFESNEPIGSCYSDGPVVDVSVWFYFVPAFTGSFIVTTDLNVLTNNDTQLAAYISSGGCGGVFTEIACNDDIDLSTSNYLSTISLPAILAGDTIWLQIDGWSSMTGTFEIQVTGTAALSHDAGIEAGTFYATGLAGYSLVPFSQNDPSGFSMDITNFGVDSISNINVTGNITPGGGSVTGSLPSLAGFSSERLTTSASSVLNSSTVYTGVFSVAIAETDSNSTNDTTFFNFTSGNISDSVFALENTISPSLQLGVIGGNGRYANRFEFTSADTITSVTVAFTTPGGNNFAISIDGFDPDSSSITNNIWSSGPLPVPGGGFHTYPVNAAVPPGSYLISVLQTDSVFLAMARTDLIARPYTSFAIPSLSGTNIPTIEDLGFPSTFIIRANMNTQQNSSVSLAPFGLLSPVSGARVETDPLNPSSPIDITWNSSSSSTGLTINYEWLMDAPGGNFSNPVVSFASNTNGTDTIKTLSSGALDSLLSSLGVPAGDSIEAIWTVRASLGANTIMADNGPFDIKIVRGFVSSLSDMDHGAAITLYPNPSIGTLMFKSSSRTIANYSIEIYDLNGSLKLSETIISENSRIHIDHLSDGIYFYNIKNDSDVFRGKLIKQ